VVISACMGDMVRDNNVHTWKANDQLLLRLNSEHNKQLNRIVIGPTLLSFVSLAAWIHSLN